MFPRGEEPEEEEEEEEEGEYEEEFDEEEEGEEVEEGEEEEEEDDEAGLDGRPVSAEELLRNLGPNHPMAATLQELMARQQVPQVQREWDALSRFPAPTQARLVDLMRQLRAEGREKLTVLILGKTGVGKSSLGNSILNERAFSVSAFGSETARPQMASRVVSNFTLSLIDTPGLIDSGSVDNDAIKSIRKSIEGKEVDVVLYVDRLDGYRIDSFDRSAVGAITRAFGHEVWKNALLVLTHGQVAQPGGRSYEDFTKQRIEMLQGLVQSSSLKLKKLVIPAAIVENTSRCNTNEAGEKVLPDGTLWLPNLVSEMVTRTLETGSPYVLKDASDPGDQANKKHKFWVLPLLLLQVKVILPMVINAMKNDSKKPLGSY